MASDAGRRKAIIDTSTLLNFLRIDRIDLLASHPTYRFVIIDLVASEVTDSVHVTRLGAAHAAGQLLPDLPAGATDPNEAQLFAAMSSVGISQADRACIAAARTRGLSLAMDDNRAWKLAAPYCGGITALDTVSIMVDLIRASILTVVEADAIKADWAANHKFNKPRFSSFAELIT